MRLLVCGSRGWTDREAIYAKLSSVHMREHVTVLIHGDCETGADRMATDWASLQRIPKQECYHADWRAHGRAAGPLRNEFMLRESKPDRAIAFRCDGRSPGTDDMIRRLRKAGVPVEVVKP